MKHSGLSFTWRLTPRSDSKYPVRAANFAVIYCFITQIQKMGQKRPTAAALCLFLTIRPKGKNYEHEKICPSTETIDVKTLSFSPCNKTLLPVLNFP